MDDQASGASRDITDQDGEVEDLLKIVSEINEPLLLDWFESFEGEDYEKRKKAKEEIRDALVAQRSGDKRRRPPSFIHKLVEKSAINEDVEEVGLWEKRIKLATHFVYAMTKKEQWKPIVDNTEKELADSEKKNVRRCASIISAAKVIKPPTRSKSFSKLKLAEAVLFGYIEDVQAHMGNIRTAEELEENICPKELNGSTLLHSAASAIDPRPDVVRCLVRKIKEIDDKSQGQEKERPREIINQRCEQKKGSNTALHVAAANPRVTREFIKELSDADSTLLNRDGETAFHIAAKSKNPEVILYLLNTFSPRRHFWDIDYIDNVACLRTNRQQSKKKHWSDICRSCLKPSKQDSELSTAGCTRLIDICARNGNKQAVELLIKNGADISRGVLHELVLESVKCPEKLDQLKQVYQVIVDNAVTWRYLEEEIKNPGKTSEAYEDTLKETMIWLLRNPLEEYGNTDVLQYAIRLGASEMFQQLVNTKGVLREEKKKGKIKYDVTNFTRSTMLKKVIPGNYKSTSTEETKPMITGNGDNDKPTTEGAKTITGNRDYDKPTVPDQPYLTYLLDCFDQWENTQILSKQPLKKLTNVYFIFIQRMYFLIGLLQLAFMLFFMGYYTPTVHSLAGMFNLSSVQETDSNRRIESKITFLAGLFSRLNERDNDLDLNSSSFGLLTTTGANEVVTEFQRAYPYWFWLVWPIWLLLGSMLWSVFNFYYTISYHEPFESVLRKFVTALAQSIIVRVFCCIFFVWFHEHRYATRYGPYVEITAMVQLFGWMASVAYFGGVNKQIHISILMVKKIMKNDIPGFILFFGFTIIGFSCAMHALRLSACEMHEDMTMRDSFYGVLSSAFGIGDFYDDMIAESTCHERTQHLFEIVYFAYVAVTLIILLNLLIAMMNNRYEVDKESAENVWRYENLSLVRAIESHEDIFESIRLMFDKCNVCAGQQTSSRRTEYVRCMMELSSYVCCFWHKHHKLPKPLDERGDSGYYLTIETHGNQ